MQTRRTHILSATAVAAANQVVTSGTNFLLGLYLLRELSLDQFGLYGTILSVSLVLAGFGNSLLLSQMVVLYPDYEGADQRRFLSSVMTIVCGASAAVTAASVIAVLAVGQGGDIVLAAGTFASGYLLKEFYARLAYTLGYEARALRVNACIALALLAELSLMAALHLPMSAVSALYCYAAAACVGAAVGHLELRLPFAKDRNHLRCTLVELWAVGRWALVNDVGYAMRQNAHVLLTATLAGTAGVGMINAARLFVAPIMMVTPAISQLYVARLVRLRKTQPLQLLRNGVTFSAVSVGAVVIYAVILYLTFPLAMGFAGGELPPDIDPIVVAWVVVALLSAVRYGLESTQKAMKRFKSLAKANLPVALLSIVAVTGLLLTMGPVGSVYGYCIGELAFVLILGRMVRMEADRLNGEGVSKR